MKVKLTDVCDIKYGYAFDSKCFVDDESCMPLIRIRDVKRGFSETYYSGIYSDEYIINSGDLLIGMDGEFNIARWKSSAALLNQRVCKITAKPEICEEYIRFILSVKLKEIERRTAFVTVKHLSAKELNKLELDIPEYEIQVKIADILQKVECILDHRNSELVYLNDLIKSRFVEMFSDCTEKKTISEICTIITDGTHQPPKFQQEGIPFIFVSNLSQDKITYETEKYISEETYMDLIKRTPIEKGDVLLTTVGSYGHPAVVVDDKKFLFQRHIAYMKPKRDIINSFYLHGAFLSPDCKRQIEERVKGIAQKTLNLSEIRKIVIPVPNLKEQEAFEDFVRHIDKLKAKVQQSLDETQILMDSLMQKYFG